jgi:hypothetical protein
MITTYTLHVTTMQTQTERPGGLASYNISLTTANGDDSSPALQLLHSAPVPSGRAVLNRKPEDTAPYLPDYQLPLPGSEPGHKAAACSAA